MTALFNYFSSHSSEILSQIIEHFKLTLSAISLATIIGVSIGALISIKKYLSNGFLSFINILQTIPSLALLGFLIPIIGIGAIPAITALFIYALLPIVRNTFTGITDLDSSIIEAGKGLGLSTSQLLFKVQLPLALPVIIAGVRTASVINVGVATLCALIAAGGLGESIFGGISLNNTQMILAGAIPASLMALLFDTVFGLVQKYSKKHLKISLGLFITLFLLSGLLFIPKESTSKLIAGFNSEFIQRRDGFVGLDSLYDLPVEIRELEIGLMYKALASEEVDFIDGFSTDGRVRAFNLKLLIDDKNYFPPYMAAPVINESTLKKYPLLEKILSKIAGKISNEKMSQLNFMVDQEKKSPEQVANFFLKSIGIKKAELSPEREPDITIGSKNFTESYILAYIFKLLIEYETGLVVDLKTGFGGTKLLFDALSSGAVDLYPEYTGTGFLVILQPEKKVIDELLNDTKKMNNYIKSEFKRRYHIIWGKELGFNNTFAIMMREKQAKELNINSISDLSEYLKK